MKPYAHRLLRGLPLRALPANHEGSGTRFVFFRGRTESFDAVPGDQRVCPAPASGPQSSQRLSVQSQTGRPGTSRKGRLTEQPYALFTSKA
jgi:hypothetical protein